MFAWLRPGDLVWNYWVNNYLLGRKPPAFDILFWNADTTRMTAGLHADFVDLAMDNKLVEPGRGDRARRRRSTCRRSTVDAYLVAGIADHITPWQNCYRSTQLLGGDEPVHPVDQRSHRRAGESARQPKGPVSGHRSNPADPEAG